MSQDPLVALAQGLRADNELRMRVIRAEDAALGAVTHLRRYIEATRAWLAAAKQGDDVAVEAAIKRLVEAHNAALSWSRSETEKARQRQDQSAGSDV